MQNYKNFNTMFAIFPFIATVFYNVCSGTSRCLFENAIFLLQILGVLIKA